MLFSNLVLGHPKTYHASATAISHVWRWRQKGWCFSDPLLNPWKHKVMWMMWTFQEILVQIVPSQQVLGAEFGILEKIWAPELRTLSNSWTIQQFLYPQRQCHSFGPIVRILVPHESMVLLPLSTAPVKCDKHQASRVLWFSCQSLIATLVDRYRPVYRWDFLQQKSIRNPAFQVVHMEVS